MQTFRKNRSTPLLAALGLLGCATAASAQQLTGVDLAVLKNACTANDQLSGSWLTYINDGRFLAYSADRGEKLLKIQTGRTGMVPPITYEIDGKQYAAFMGGSGRPAAIVGPNNAKVDNPPLLFVFELDGKAELPERFAAAAPSAAAPARGRAN